MNNLKNIKRRQIKIDGYKIGANQSILIIAEAGINHNGDPKLAKKMIDAAKVAGADAVKFQFFHSEELATAYAPKAAYQQLNDKARSQLGMLKRLELSEGDFQALYRYCLTKKIIFLATPFDPSSAESLEQLGIKAFKISSGDLINHLLLKQVARFGKPIILSTGMATLVEVKEAVKVIRSSGNQKIILLHCTSAYPAKYGEINLRAMETLANAFNLPVGYSDHSQGGEVVLAAVALGACVIEKHFTLDKDFPGPDHKASLEPEEFKKMVESIRNVEAAMGDGIKKPRKSEMEMRKIARKSIVAAVDIPRGGVIRGGMLAIKRPGTGILPKHFNRLIGKHVKRKVKKDRVLNWGLIS